MPSSPIHGRRRSNRIVTKKRASLVITLSGVQMFPCLIVDRSKEGFRLRGNFNRWAKESWCFDPNSLSACCAWLLLSAGSPIGGRIRNAPKTRCGPCEFHRTLSRARRLLLHRYHPAPFFFPAFFFFREGALPLR